MTTGLDRALVEAEFDNSIFPGGSPNLDEAWLGMYQVLLYYDQTITPPLLHVNEVNDLRKPPWRKKAQIAEDYIATALGVAPSSLPGLVDRMMKLPRWQGKQRHNCIGNGLRTLVAEVLKRWGHSSVDYRQEEKATSWFPGITMPGRSETPSIDVMMVKSDVPRCVLSCKWSIRHDRISDPTNECQEYRAAAARRQFPAFGYYVFTNEFSPARLEKVLNQPCVDGLVHVHLPLVKAMHQAAHPIFTDPKLIDLAAFVRHTATW